MSLVSSTPGRSPQPSGPRLPRPVRWGSVYHAVPRHGVGTSRLIVYSPVSSEHERFWARSASAFAPVSLSVGLLLWLLLVAIGASPEASAVGIVLVGVSTGAFLWWKARPLRGRVATAWSSRFVLWPHRDDEDREEKITTLSLLMERATQDLRHGRITRSVYDHVWMAVYEETHALSPGRDK